MKSSYILTFSLAFFIQFFHVPLHSQIWSNSTYTYDVTDHPYGYQRHECGGTMLDLNGEPVGVIIGGRGSNRKTILFYPLQNRVDVANERAPYELHHMQAVQINDSTAVCGMGFTGGFPNETPNPNVLAYDVRSDTYSTIATIPAARRRGGAAAAADGNWIYFFSGLTDGHNGGWQPWTDRYNYVTDTWEQLPDAPRARDHSFAIKEDNKVYLIGGRRSDADGPGGLNAFLVDEVDVFNLTTLTWEASPMSLPRSRAGALVFHRKNGSGELEISVWGGEVNGGALSSGDLLNINTQSATTLPDMLDPRHATLIFQAPNDSKLYTLAGAYNGGWENQVPWPSYVQEYSIPEILPVEWLDLRAIHESAGVRIDWQVHEHAVRDYQIQRKSAGAIWEVVGSLPAQGDGENSYTFWDKSPDVGTLLNYRIVSTDYDGSKNFSRTLELSVALINLQAYPNPVSTTTSKISVNTEVGKLELLDIQGKVLFQNLDSDHLDLSHTLSSGMYFLRAFRDGQLIYTEKFWVE